MDEVWPWPVTAVPIGFRDGGWGDFSHNGTSPIGGFLVACAKCGITNRCEICTLRCVGAVLDSHVRFCPIPGQPM